MNNFLKSLKILRYTGIFKAGQYRCYQTLQLTLNKNFTGLNKNRERKSINVNFVSGNTTCKTQLHKLYASINRSFNISPPPGQGTFVLFK